MATINVSVEQEDLIREFLGKQPAREISVVTLKNYAGERRIKVMQEIILENIPQRMKKQPTDWIVDTNIKIKKNSNFIVQVTGCDKLNGPEGNHQLNNPGNKTGYCENTGFIRFIII